MNMSSEFIPFKEEDIKDYFSRHRKNIFKNLKKDIDENEIEKVLEKENIKKFEIFEDQISQEVRGGDLLIFVPYIGEEYLLKKQPNIYSSYIPSIAIKMGGQPQELIFRIPEFEKESTNYIKDMINKNISSIKQYFTKINEEIDEHKKTLKDMLHSEMKKYQESLKLREDKLKELGIPERK